MNVKKIIYINFNIKKNVIKNAHQKLLNHLLNLIYVNFLIVIAPKFVYSRILCIVTEGFAVVSVC